MSTRFDVTAVGETMVRLSVYEGTRLENADRLEVHTGGAESNVLAALSQLSYRCAWVGGLADNDMGRRAANDLRRAGIDISGAISCPKSRMGLYFVEHAGAPLTTRAVYDRAQSCGAALSPDQIDWDLLLNSRIVHLTGITPALSESARSTVEEVVAKAQSQGVLVSFDVNYRSKLWAAEQATKTLGPLIEAVDILICSHRDALNLFACDADPAAALRQLTERTTARLVVLTLGERGAIASDRSSLFEQAPLTATVVDRLGAGDAFAAGVLHGILSDDVAMGLRHGAALSSLALSQFGDMVTTSLAEIATLTSSSADAVDR